jgi:hypothetical protein
VEQEAELGEDEYEEFEGADTDDEDMQEGELGGKKGKKGGAKDGEVEIVTMEMLKGWQKGMLEVSPSLPITPPSSQLVRSLTYVPSSLAFADPLPPLPPPTPPRLPSRRPLQLRLFLRPFLPTILRLHHRIPRRLQQAPPHHPQVHPLGPRPPPPLPRLPYHGPIQDDQVGATGVDEDGAELYGELDAFDWAVAG